VYVDHTGPLTPNQRRWVAVLARWPAALARESALGEPTAGVIHLAVDRDRTVDPLPGVETHRMTDLQRRTDWRATPPQIRPHESVVDTMVAKLDEDDVAEAFAVLARACFRRTNPDRIARALAGRRRVRQVGVPGGVPHRPLDRGDSQETRMAWRGRAVSGLRELKRCAVLSSQIAGAEHRTS